ncbi:MAG: hypothetical protein IBX58_13925 [Roseovarius sp.]|nr:hypothetical protein [Roseovarius sp.]
MASGRRYIMAGGTLACALGIAYLMQARPGPAAVAPVTPVADAPLEITGIVLTAAPALPDVQPPAPAILPAVPVTRVVARDMPMPDAFPADESIPGLACEVTMSATVIEAAMARLDIAAPCKPGARFTLHHTGMMVSAMTDAQGYGRITVPALSEAAVFIASFEGGEGAVAVAQVPDLAGYDRFVVQWHGDADSLRLHALEYGADFGQPGHVWSGVEAADGDGTLSRLGGGVPAPAHHAEIYTFPTVAALRGGSITLRLEAEVTSANCGRDLEAQSLSAGAPGGLVVQDVLLPMPDCSAIGEFLVLQNLFDDLKIAQN